MAETEQPAAQAATDTSADGTISLSERERRAQLAERSIHLFYFGTCIALATFCLTLGVLQRAAPVAILGLLALWVGRQRLLRFGIRGVLTLTLLAAIPLAWFGAAYRTYWAEQSVIDLLGSRGVIMRGKPQLSGVVQDLLTPAAEDTFRRVESALLRGDGVQDEELTLLLKLLKLRRLVLSNTRVTSAGLARLESAPIEELQLDRYNAGDSALAALVHWPSLREVKFSAVPLNAEGLAGLRGLPHLERLELALVDLSDASMAEIARYKLRQLELSNLVLTEAHLNALQGADGIKTITLTNVQAPWGLAMTLPARVRKGRIVELKGVRPPPPPPPQ